MDRRAIAGLLNDIARIEELLASPINGVQIWDEIGSRTQILGRVATSGQLAEIARKIRVTVRQASDAQAAHESDIHRTRLREYVAQLRAELRKSAHG